jgi:hypothetical protein
LRKRNAELGAPSPIGARHGYVPHSVPPRIVVRIVVPVAVQLDARGIDRELVRGAAIVKGVHDDADPVGG